MGEPLVPFGRCAVVGLGLMGGSLGLALRGAGARVVGFDADPSVAARALSLGLVDETARDLAGAVAGAELAVLAAPAGAVPDLLRTIASLSSRPALVTDLASTKEEIISAWRALPPPRPVFIGGHPITGTERSGPEAATAGLYAGALVVLTPDGAEADSEAATSLAEMWRALGARVVLLDAATHDRLMAWVSHLPHAAAYALVHSLLDAESPEALETFVAGGFRDFTRIAASSPAMWRDICLTNAAPLLGALEAYLRHLNDLKDLIEARDGDGLQAFFDRARSLRCLLVPDGRGMPE